LLVGCGFQLRGHYTLPDGVKTVYLHGNASKQLLRDLRNSFTRSGAKMVTTSSGADAVLTVHEEKQDRRVLSVGGTAKVIEYEVIYQLEFSFKHPRDKTLLNHNNIVLRRDFTFDEDDVLAKEREENILKREMQREAVQAVMRRIAYTRHGK
jgi:LPS-assembly lipoprotein